MKNYQTIKSELKRNYDKIFKNYKGYRRKPWPELVRFMKGLNGKTILDIGSGTCPETRKLAKENKVTAVDFSKEALKLCPDNIEMIIADATKIPLKRKFDRIIAISLMHHLPTDKERLLFLKEVKRLLKPSGKAFITVWSGSTGDRFIKWGKYKRYYHFFIKEELIKLLDQSKLNYKIKKSGRNFFIKIKK